MLHLKRFGIIIADAVTTTLTPEKTIWVDFEEYPMNVFGQTKEGVPAVSYDELPLFLSVEQLAAVLGIGRNTAYNLIRSKRIFSVRVGRQIRIPKSAIIDIS